MTQGDLFSLGVIVGNLQEILKRFDIKLGATFAENKIVMEITFSNGVYERKDFHLDIPYNELGPAIDEFATKLVIDSLTENETIFEW